MENSLRKWKTMYSREITPTKWVGDTCRILPGWKNHYGNKSTRTTKDNDRMAFMTISNEGEQANEKK